MITVAICDDEIRFRKNILQCCRRYFEEKQIEFEITEYDSGENFLKANHPDILLLDITMRRVSGFMVREILAKTHAKSRIIFFAENKNFVTEAFGKNVFGYLIKPVRYQMFCSKMNEVVEDILESEQYVYCKNGKEIERVYIKSILYIESFGRYTKVYVQGADGYRVSDKGVCKWRELLCEVQFASCNRLQMVNLCFVKKVTEDIELVNGAHIPLSKCFEEEFQKKYENWGKE